MKNRNLFIYLLLSLSAIALCTSSTPASKTIFFPAKLTEPIGSFNTVFLWDFHDVIAKRNKRKTLSTVWNFPKKGTILKKTSRTLLSKMIKMIGNSATTSEELIHVIRDQNNPELEELIYQIANIQEPIPGTVALIQKLHCIGYQHYIGSNIGSSIFADLINPLKHPQFAPLFSQFNLEHPQTVDFDLAHPEKTIKKPAPEFYQEFLRKNNIDLATTNVIFVDDRLENVRAAQKAGFIGIHFKNANQLKTDVEKILCSGSRLATTSSSMIQAVEFNHLFFSKEKSMKRMLSLLCLASVLVAAPLLAVEGGKCCGNKPRPGRPVRTADQATDKCGCNNKPRGAAAATKGCGSCNSCNSCNNKPCCGR